MRKLAYALVIVACGLVILDYGYSFYEAARATAAGRQLLEAELRGDPGAYCRAQWSAGEVYQACIKDDIAGRASFAAAWQKPELSTEDRVAMINCFMAARGRGGEMWSLAASCAAPIPS
jgi:hypothetical protein